MTTLLLHSPDLLPQVEAVQAVPDHREQQRAALIQEITAVVRSHYEHGAVSVTVADVDHFSDADECAHRLRHLSLEHLQYVRGMVTGQRIPRPASLERN
ncbi:MAG: hypothetical protein Greene041619_604 [Candidatus Peregrinibacteria bacterium Greene0416_19]|nr:MAG: hypothetical protein Greene041619_604 [Candidatus Peregrinibacteria bacterium Greene0416_19]